MIIATIIFFTHKSSLFIAKPKLLDSYQMAIILMILRNLFIVIDSYKKSSYEKNIEDVTWKHHHPLQYSVNMYVCVTFAKEIH